MCMRSSNKGIPNMSSVIIGFCAWITGKGDQIGSARLEEDVHLKASGRLAVMQI